MTSPQLAQRPNNKLISIPDAHIDDPEKSQRVRKPNARYNIDCNQNENSFISTPRFLYTMITQNVPV